MKVTPTGAPAPQAPQQNNSKADARARAISMLTGDSQPQQTTPVPNPNNITAEDFGAIRQSMVREPVIPEPNIEAAVEAEQAKPEVKQPSEAEQRAQRKFLELARQEKAQRAKEQALKQREDELKAREEAFKTQPSFDESKYIPKDRIKQDILGVMAETGLTYEEITQELLNQPNRDPRVDAELNSLKNEIKRLHEANEQAKKAQEQQQAEAYQTALKQIESDVKSLVSQDPSFEAIKASKAEKDVVELIEQTYNQDGILLSVEEAAQMVEDFLVEEYTAKVSKINKIKQKIEQSQATKAQSTSVKPSESEQQPQTKMKTLTNSVGSTKPLTSRERAMLAFEGKLK